jgi:hypothetical protein
VLFGKIAVVLRADGTAVNFFDVVASANPFVAQRGQTLFDVSVKLRIAPRAARVVDAHRLVRLESTVEVFGRREADLAHRHAQSGMEATFQVNFF